MLKWLRQAGIPHMMIELLEEDHYVSWFNRQAEHNPKGLGSSATVIKVKNLLLSLGFIEEYQADVRLRLYLRLTEKGKQVAEHLKAIQDLLSTNP